MTTLRTATITMLLALVAAACSSAPAPSQPVSDPQPTALAGTSWSVVDVAGRPPVGNSHPTVIFGTTEIRGSSGCNRYGGNYRYDPATGRIDLDENLFMTEMACPDGRDAFESAFMKVLTKATDASLDANGRLVLSGAGGQILLAAAP